MAEAQGLSNNGETLPQPKGDVSIRTSSYSEPTKIKPPSALNLFRSFPG